MQPNAFLRNGTSVYEDNTGGYQTSYVFHLENPVRYQNEIKVTIEHGHVNHLANEMSSVAYWYADRPTYVLKPPPPQQRLSVLKDDQGNWINQCFNSVFSDIELNDQMRGMKRKWTINNR